MVEVIKEVQEICNGTVKVYSGNGHTTSRVADGMVFLSQGVIAAGKNLLLVELWHPGNMYMWMVKMCINSWKMSVI